MFNDVYQAVWGLKKLVRMAKIQFFFIVIANP